MLNNIRSAWGRAQATTKRCFPEHQIYFRTNGNVRYFTVSTRSQLTAVSVAGLLAGWLVFASSSFWLKNDALLDKERAIASQQRQLAAMQERIQALNSDISDLKTHVSLSASRLKQRQTFLQQLFAGRVQPNGETAKWLSKDKEEAAKAGPLTREQQAALQDYRKLETEQLAFADSAAAAAEKRYVQLDGLLRKMGLSAEKLVKASPAAGINTGMGGPLIKASFERGAYSTLEPQFKDLYMSWTKLDLLQKAMLSIPAFLPAKNFTFTSGFGYRYDPFTGATALHSGVDMAGPIGTPIMASADGVVTKAGWANGYGKLVEIDHGRGLVTRYAHLNTIDVNVGDTVQQGQQIGGMGSTGRSTGSHLHYEVRINGTAVNPMPFLEAARDVLEVQQSVDAGAPIADPAG